MKKLILLALCTLLLYYSHGQNLFSKKVEGCKVDMFCLDCGDIKANVNETDFAQLIAQLNTSKNLRGLSGKLMIQVLVDSVGKACVLSHTDDSELAITKEIVTALNSFEGWSPAVTKGKKEYRTSINMIFEIKNNTVTGRVDRVDMEAFKKSFDHPNDPEIFNKKYKYKNQNLGNYTFTVLNKKNSDIPDHWNDHISIDKNDNVYFSLDDGLAIYDGTNFKSIGQNRKDNGKPLSYSAIATDNNNVKWISSYEAIYTYDNGNWTRFDSSIAGTDGAYGFVNNAATSELFICASEGLFIIDKNNKWNKIDTSVIKELPENGVYFAKRDSKGNLWIGTFKGTIMQDTKGKITEFNKGNTPVKDRCITSLAEDNNGNIYLGLFKYGENKKGEINRDEGFAVLDNKGKWKKFTTANSGLPFNHTMALVFDKNENVLWIATDRAGLVRWDLKDGWENYHNLNSPIPTSYVSEMDIDTKGNIWLATRQGLVKIEKKK